MLSGAGSPAGTGLSAADVRERTLAGLSNEAPDDQTRSLWLIIRANVFTLFNAIVGGCFILLLFLGQWRDALFGFAALSNAIIGVAQEYRAKRLLDRLAVLNAPRARALREGLVREIAVADVVRDDIVVLQAGDQVVADAVVLQGDGLELDESLLTGESEPVAKVRGSEVLSGATVMGGQGTVLVTRVGPDSYARRLTAEAKRFSLVNSEIRNGIGRVLRFITWALLPVMAIVVNGQMQAQGGWNQALATGAWRGALVGATGGIIAMIPLGLLLMSSVAFAIGGVRLARQNVLVQELAAVEGLARVDVLCIDKTGTLTEGRMVFDAVHALAAPSPAGWEEALGWFGNDPHANSTARCLAGNFPGLAGQDPAVVVPFSSARKWSAAAFEEPHPAAGTWILGAPELLLGPDDAGAAVKAASAELSRKGLRTLLLAHAWQVMNKDAAGREELPRMLNAVVLLTFREKVRPDAARTLSFFRQQGVVLKVLSGDDHRTVAAVAREVGLNAGSGYDARLLPSDPDKLAEILNAYSIFGRVTPQQKKEMVHALQRSGHTVAMTGDGVNDALALKEADLGIAMDSAAPATKAVARLVLLDGRFERLPAVLAEGRQVIANIERVSVLFLSKTTYALALSVTFGALMWNFPFLPRQLSVTDGITIGVPAFFLALMGNSRRYTPGFLKRSLAMAVPAGIIITLAVVAVELFSRAAGGFSAEASRTASVITLSLVALTVLGAVSRPLNLARLGIIAAMCLTLGLVLTIPALQEFLLLEWPPPPLAAASLLAAAGGMLAMELLRRAHARRFPAPDPSSSGGPFRR